MTNGGSPRHERSIDPSEVQFDKKSMPSNSDIECRRKRNRLSLKQLEFSGISELEWLEIKCWIELDSVGMNNSVRVAEFRWG